MNLKRIANHDEMVPMKFRLSQNYPNPFTVKTKIKYCVACKTKVKINVYTPEGKLVENLLDDVKCEGTYEIEFNAYTNKSQSSRSLSEGNYFYTMEATNFIDRKVMTIKK